MTFARRLQYAALAAAVAFGAGSTRALAQSEHDHGVRAGSREEQRGGRTAALIKAVRESTEQFKDVDAAEDAGYHLMFGCVSGPDYGAMGLHYVNLALVGDGEIDVAKPEIVIYEPLPRGGARITGADFLVFADQWNAKHATPPEVMGQLMHLVEAPNRYGLPSFYTLHVWAWKESATGSFVMWHPDVSCDAYQGGK